MSNNNSDLKNSLGIKRVLVKISGEALLGSQSYGIDPFLSLQIAQSIKEIVKKGYEVAIVVGGGNIFRGVSLEQQGLNRVTGDQMGMLATIMNGLALQSSFEQIDVPSRVMSSIPMITVCQAYSQTKALDHFDKERVLILCGGTGNPFFTTDTASVLRAAELNCDAVIKATNVDGIYDKDPKKFDDAKRYDRISYQDALEKNLKVMDATAFALARDAKLKIIVCSLNPVEKIVEVLDGKGNFSLVE